MSGRHDVAGTSGGLTCGTFIRPLPPVGGINTVVAFGGFPLLYLTIGSRVGYLSILVFCSAFNPLFSFLMHKFVTFECFTWAGGAGDRSLSVVLHRRFSCELGFSGIN